MKRVLLGGCFLFLNSCLWAIVTKRGIDSVGNATFASATSVSWTHVIPSTTTCPYNLFIAVCGNDASTITSVKLKGVALNQQVQLTSTETSQIWTLSNSTNTGLQTIVATFGALVNGYCGSVVFCGADLTNPVDATNTAQATSSNPSTSVTVVSSGSWIVDSLFNNGTSMIPTPSADNTVASAFNAGGPSAIASQINGPYQSGSQTLSWTEPISAAWTHTIMSIKPSTGTPIAVTNNTTAITATSATGNGVLLSTAGYALTQEGICIATNHVPTISDTCVTATGTPFTANFTGLTPNTLYHCRAYGTNSEGTDYGQDIPFVTLGGQEVSFTSGDGNMTITSGDGNLTIR